MNDLTILSYLVDFRLWLLMGINWLYFVLLVSYLYFAYKMVRKAWNQAKHRGFRND
jgi:hypothetical protein